MPIEGLTLRSGGDNWSWLARCSVLLPPGTREWLGLVSHSLRRNTLACWLSAKYVCVCVGVCVCVCVRAHETHMCICVYVYP